MYKDEAPLIATCKSVLYIYVIQHEPLIIRNRPSHACVCLHLGVEILMKKA